MRMKNNGWARILTGLLVAAVVIGFMPQLGITAYAASGDPAMNPGADVIDQNVNTSDAETIWYADKAWRVIGYDGKDGGAASKSGAVTLLSAENFEKAPFAENSPYSNVYAESILKTKVDAIAGSFSDGEQGAIVKKKLVHGDYNGSDTDCIAGDEDIADVLLWPLSTKEANAVNSDLRIVDPEHTDEVASYWWLRSPGSSDDAAAFVRGDGTVNNRGFTVSQPLGFRLAFDLNLESVLLTSAAEGGKSSGDCGADALKAVSDNTTNEWKLTLKDASRSGFEASAASGATLEMQPSYSDWSIPVVYSGANTGDKEFVSVILCDSNGTAKYYGNIAKNSAASSESGQAVNIPAGLSAGNYTMYVFSEQINGDKLTDYASEFRAIDLKVKAQPATQTITASNVTKTYGNAAFSLGAKTDGDGTLTYKSGNTKVATVSSTGKVTIKGAGTAKITISASATENYKAASKTITITVNKAANPLKMSAKTATVKYSKLKKKNQTLAVTKVIKFTKKGQGTMSYTLSSAKKGSKSFKKYFEINKKTGKVTVKKGLKKGTYKVKVKVKAAGNANYKASTVKTVTFKVKVR